nr:basic proline-rich protein-like [Aegilops tauschii subsp. strangulata]
MSATAPTQSGAATCPGRRPRRCGPPGPGAARPGPRGRPSASPRPRASPLAGVSEGRRSPAASTPLPIAPGPASSAGLRPAPTPPHFSASPRPSPPDAAPTSSSRRRPALARVPSRSPPRCPTFPPPAPSSSSSSSFFLLPPTDTSTLAPGHVRHRPYPIRSRHLSWPPSPPLRPAGPRRGPPRPARPPVRLAAPPRVPARRRLRGPPLAGRLDPAADRPGPRLLRRPPSRAHASSLLRLASAFAARRRPDLLQPAPPGARSRAVEVPAALPDLPASGALLFFELEVKPRRIPIGSTPRLTSPPLSNLLSP